MRSPVWRASRKASSRPVGSWSALSPTDVPEEDNAAGRPVDPRPPAADLPAAQRLFGDRLPIAVRSADLLLADGVIRGLIGPREAPRIWYRHLLNCPAVAEL